MLAEPGLTPEMRRFVGEVARVVGEGGGERIVTQRLAAGLRALLRERNVLDERHTRPKLDQYALYPVWIAPRGEFSIAAAVWGVGQVTPIHDHGTWGVIGIYRGSSTKRGTALSRRLELDRCNAYRRETFEKERS